MKILKNESVPFGRKIKHKQITFISRDVINKMKAIDICHASTKNEVYHFLIEHKIIDWSQATFDRIYMQGRYYDSDETERLENQNIAHDDEDIIKCKIDFYRQVCFLKTKTSHLMRVEAINILKKSNSNKEKMDVIKYWSSNFDKEAKKQIVETDITLKKEIISMTDEELENIIKNG